MRSRHWTSEERYFDYCPMCGEKFPMVRMVTIKKAKRYGSKNLTKLCNNCYIKLLDFIGINDVILWEEE